MWYTTVTALNEFGHDRQRRIDVSVHADVQERDGAYCSASDAEEVDEPHEPAEKPRRGPRRGRVPARRCVVRRGSVCRAAPRCRSAAECGRSPTVRARVSIPVGSTTVGKREGHLAQVTLDLVVQEQQPGTGGDGTRGAAERIGRTQGGALRHRHHHDTGGPGLQRGSTGTWRPLHRRQASGPSRLHRGAAFQGSPRWRGARIPGLHGRAARERRWRDPSPPQ